MRTLFIIILLSLSGFLFSQSQYDTKLLAKFDKNYLDKQVKENPHFIERQNYIVENSYEIINSDELPSGCDLKELTRFNYLSKTYLNIPVGDSDLIDFNIFKYYTEPGKKQDDYYNIGNTGKVLKVFSIQKQTQLYNQFRKNN